jgi:flavin reductase (DIM6/NTAB) family NADH-FMN oxidoreductase RutF
MAKTDIAYTEYFEQVTKVLTSRGLLLTCADQRGKPNAMTIGWGTIGSVWGMPLWLVLVRPSRYTYELIERAGDFTVNVPPQQLAQACSHCGSVSGRDQDKFKQMKLTAHPGRAVSSPVIAECPINYECRVVHKNDVVPAALAREIVSSAYPSGNYHRVYWGRIVAAYADVAGLSHL